VFSHALRIVDNPRSGWPVANGSARRNAAQADARPEGLARPRVAVGKDQHAARGWGMAGQ